MKKSRQQKRREATEARKKAAKKLRQKNKPAPKSETPPPSPPRFHLPRWFHRPLSFSWKLLVAFSVVLGVIVALLTFLPRLSVSSLESLNPASPFTAPFVVENEGILSVKDITCQCLVRRVVVAGMQSLDMSDNRVETADPAIPVLHPNEKTTVNCPSMIGLDTPVTRADMDIILTYKPSFTPFHRTKTFRFTTEMASDKRLRWFPRSSSE